MLGVGELPSSENFQPRSRARIARALLLLAVTAEDVNKSRLNIVHEHRQRYCTGLVRLRLRIGGGWPFFGLGTKIGAAELTQSS